MALCFLLFMIGLELSIERLKALRAYVFGLGGLQVSITSIIFGTVSYHIFSDISLAIIVGGALALSSTAIVMQILQERGEQHTQVGRTAFSILLLQDLAVLPLLIALPILSGAQELNVKDISFILVEAGLGVVLVVILGKLVLNPIFRFIAGTRRQELFSAATLLIALGSAWITHKAGLSLALGGFLAGVLVAETKFQKQVESDITPYKGLLLGLFFMTVGMSLNLGELYVHLPAVIAVSLLIVVSKTIVITLLCKMFKMRTYQGLQVALILSQCSEFAFILFGLAIDSNLLAKDKGQFLLMVVTFSMAITPMLVWIGKRVASRAEKHCHSEEEMIKSDLEELENHFIICGFGWVGETLCEFLKTQGISYVALDHNASRVALGRKKNIPVYYGDAERIDLLKSLHIEKCKAVIVTIHDHDKAVRVVKNLHDVFGEIEIVVRIDTPDSAAEVKDLGANIVVPEAYESSIQIGKVALKLSGHSPEDTARIVQDYRDKLDIE